jgi:hypothetical protein
VKLIANATDNQLVVKPTLKLSVGLEKGRKMPHAKKLGKVTFHPVRSSNIQSIGYDPEQKSLHVKFHSGSAGLYSNVDHNTFVVILAAPSKGKALHHLVTKHPDKYPWVPHEK